MIKTALYLNVFFIAFFFSGLIIGDSTETLLLKAYITFSAMVISTILIGIEYFSKLFKH